MSAYRPPLQDVPIFDSANFAVNLDAPLTLGEGLKYFLSYPNAQGTQNFTDINVNGIGSFPANIQTSFISAIVGGGPFYIDGDTDGGDIQITTKQVGNKIRIQNLDTVIATFETNETGFGVITGYLNGTSNNTYSVLSPVGTPNGSIMYSDGYYSYYISNAGSNAGDALLTNGEGVVPSWGSPNYTYNIIGGSANKIVYQTGDGVTDFLPTGTSGQSLLSGGAGSSPVWGTPATATNLAGGSANQIHYQTGANTSAFLPTGTSGQSLISQGAGSSPIWGNNLGYISAINTIGNNNYTTLATDFNKVLYFTGATAKNVILSTPTSTVPVTTPDGSSIIIVNRATLASAGVLNVYATSIASANRLIILDIPIENQTRSIQCVYYTALGGWIALYGNA
jgi:hypothetical protein